MPALNALSIELRRYKYAARLLAGRFRNNEPVHAVFERFCKPGDCVVDIGANVGHYTKHLSDLVGAGGRVLAFEPIPESLALLAMNALSFRFRNVTCLGLALDDRTGQRSMAIPLAGRMKRNLYLSSFTSDAAAGLTVRAVSYDDLALGVKPALINVCAEGAEIAVLSGMQRCLAAFRPILVVENKSRETADWLVAQGYEVAPVAGSPSVLATTTRQERQ